jgi:hypothetical protein
MKHGVPVGGDGDCLEIVILHININFHSFDDGILFMILCYEAENYVEINIFCVKCNR